MAVSLGQAVLAFAGGAAQQFNADVEREQKLKDDRQKRLQAMEETAATKQAETEFSTRFQDWHDNESLVRQVESVGGVKTGAGQALLAKHNKLSWQEVRATGSMGKLGLPPKIEQPIPLSELQKKLLSSQYDPDMVKYASKRDFSNKVDSKGRAIPKTQTPREDGSLNTMDVLGEVGITEDMPGDVLIDGTNFSENEWDQMAQILGGETREIKYDADRGGFATIDPTTLEAGFVPAGDQGEEGIPTEGKENIFTLTKNRDELEQFISDPSKSPEERVNAQRRLDTINKVIENQEIPPSMTEAALEHKMRDSRRLDTLQTKLSQLGRASTLLDNYMNEATAATGGVAGFTGEFMSAVTSNIRGAAEMLGLLEARTPGMIESELKSAGISIDDIQNLDSGILRGVARHDRVNLFYAMASTFKDVRRDTLSNADIENAKKALGGAVGSNEQTGALLAYKRQLNANIRSTSLDVYDAVGIHPQERARAGATFLTTLGLEENSEFFIMPDNNVYIPNAKGQLEPLDSYLERSPQLRNR